MRLMAALMTDVINGGVTPVVCNAACNAAGKIIKVVELQHRFGHKTEEGGVKDLQLYAPAPEQPSKAQEIARLEAELKALKATG